MIAGAGLLLAVGCGEPRETQQVTGVVTFQGAPVPKGTVTFTPKSGGRPSRGQIQSDGTYSLSTYETGDGAKPGNYTVTVLAKESVSATSIDDIQAGKAAKPAYLVPKKFSSIAESGLTATVEPGANEIDFNLP